MEKNKLLILSALIFQGISFSETKLSFKTKVESKHVGEFYKNINKLDFYKEQEIVKFTPIDLKLNLNDNIEIGTNVYKTLQKRRNNLSPLSPRVSFKLQSPVFSNYRLYYQFMYDKDNNYWDNIEAGNIKHTFGFNYDNSFTLEVNFDNLLGKMQNRGFKLNSKNKLLDFNLETNEIFDQEKYFKKLRNTQNLLNEEDDGHNHNTTVDVFSYLDYDVHGDLYAFYPKTFFKNFETKVGINKDINISKIDTKLNLNAKYENLKLHNYFDDDLIFNVNKHNFKADLNFNKTFIDSLKTKFGASVKYSNVNQDVIKDPQKSTPQITQDQDLIGAPSPSAPKPPKPARPFVDPQKTKLQEKLLINHHVTSNNSISNVVYSDISYTYRPFSKFTLNAGLKSSLELQAKWKTFEKSFEEKRKSGYEIELKQTQDKRKELEKDIKKAQEYENQVKDLKEKYEKEKVKEDEFLNKTDYTSEITTLYKEEKEKPWNKSKKEEEITLVRNRTDEKELVEKFKKDIANKTLDEINNMVKEKNTELNKLEEELKINLKKNRENAIELSRELIRTNSQQEKVQKIKAFAEKKSLNPLKEKANEYVELLEYKGTGVYATINSKFVAKKALLNRTTKSAYKTYIAKVKEFNVDPNVFNQYKVILDAKKPSYTLNASFNPYMSAKYHFNPNLSISSKLSAEIELSKKLAKNTKLVHHIHFNPSIELNYIW